jgi:hypothetical protein
MEFHANGPKNNFITVAAKGSTLTSGDDGTGTFFEKIVEISDALYDNLRMTLFVTTQVQATFGPDRYGTCRSGQGTHQEYQSPDLYSRARIRGSRGIWTVVA